MSVESFDQFALSAPLKGALSALGYKTPTPVQSASITAVLSGHNLLGCSQTGTGKTGAFALPLLQLLSRTGRRPARHQARSLVLTPTRELAMQIAASFKDYGRGLRLKLGVIYGGVKQSPQVRSCANGLDVLVATPGRLLDLIVQGHLSLASLEVFVLDEADRMLDMGFLPDVRRVLAMIPARTQTLFFSATMPPAIEKLATSILHNPVRVQIAPSATPVERIEQQVLFVEQNKKLTLLGDLLGGAGTVRVMVFVRTKHGADKLVQQLLKTHVSAEAIHGNKSQNARQNALANFRNGRTRVLVATDIASRGIDVEDVSHVINYDLPNEPECYVHRIGRISRAGAVGVAISFCNPQERGHLRGIERLMRRSVPEYGSVALNPAVSPLPQNRHSQRRAPSQSA